MKLYMLLALRVEIYLKLLMKKKQFTGIEHYDENLFDTCLI